MYRLFKEELNRYLLNDLSLLVLSFLREKEVFVRQWTGDLICPRHIEITETNEIVIDDHTGVGRYGNCIKTFSPEGKLLSLWKNQEERYPNLLPQSFILPNGEILKFTKDHTYVFRNKEGKEELVGEWKDLKGYPIFIKARYLYERWEIFAGDILEQKIYVFDPQGTLLRSWRHAGYGKRQFSDFRNITFLGDEIIILNRGGNRRVQFFRTTLV